MNISLLLDMTRDGFGQRILLGSRHDGISGEDLHRRSVGGARALRQSGATAVIYVGANATAFPVALFAAARAGVPLVPLNYRLGDEQLSQLVRRHPGALAVTDSGQLQRVRQAGAETITTGQWLARTAELAGEAIEPPESQTEAAIIIYTSGTTSAPKGVLIKHSNLLSYVFGSVEFGSADAAEAALVSVPPYHIAAVANAITNLYAGRRTVPMGQFSPEQWLGTARDEQITNAMVVPTMLARIMSVPGDLRVPSLRTVAYGGAAMPLPVIERALQGWPNVDFVNAYGLTETSSTIAILTPEDHRAAVVADDPAIRARLTSVGHVVPSIELQIRDEDGTVITDSRPGRIFVRGEQVSGHYTSSGSVLGSDGFFDTKDLGHLDAHGYLFVHGRADDTIIRGGENIAPAEIENVLLAHPDVTDAIVVGIPDEEWGQHVEAAVALRAGATATGQALREHVRSRLRTSKTPDRIHIWDELPRTETGKLVRRDAVQRIAAEPQPSAPRTVQI